MCAIERRGEYIQLIHICDPYHIDAGSRQSQRFRETDVPLTLERLLRLTSHLDSCTRAQCAGAGIRMRGHGYAARDRERYRVGLPAVKAKGREQLTLADGLSADAEPSERVAPATARGVSPVSWSGSIGFALSDSESGDPKPTPSQTDGRRCRDALGDHQQPHGRHVRRTGVVHV